MTCPKLKGFISISQFTQSNLRVASKPTLLGKLSNAQKHNQHEGLKELDQGGNQENKLDHGHNQVCDQTMTALSLNQVECPVLSDSNFPQLGAEEVTDSQDEWADTELEPMAVWQESSMQQEASQPRSYAAVSVASTNAQ